MKSLQELVDEHSELSDSVVKKTYDLISASNNMTLFDREVNFVLNMISWFKHMKIKSIKITPWREEIDGVLKIVSITSIKNKFPTKKNLPIKSFKFIGTNIDSGSILNQYVRSNLCDHLDKHGLAKSLVYDWNANIYNIMWDNCRTEIEAYTTLLSEQIKFYLSDEKNIHELTEKARLMKESHKDKLLESIKIGFKKAHLNSITKEEIISLWDLIDIESIHHD